ncbi:hypothetical protein Hanom_Chr02g00128921 [Helianthus anomalus]
MSCHMGGISTSILINGLIFFFVVLNMCNTKKIQKKDFFIFKMPRFTTKNVKKYIFGGIFKLVLEFSSSHNKRSFLLNPHLGFI